MSLAVSNFYCKKCKILFEGKYKPQQRPRKACPNCHKMCEMSRKIPEFNQKNDTEIGGGTLTPPPPTEGIEELSSEALEKRLVDALNAQPNNAILLGKAIEFFIKVKGKIDTIDDDIDMDVLREIGINL